MPESTSSHPQVCRQGRGRAELSAGKDTEDAVTQGLERGGGAGCSGCLGTLELGPQGPAGVALQNPEAGRDVHSVGDHELGTRLAQRSPSEGAAAPPWVQGAEWPPAGWPFHPPPPIAHLRREPSQPHSQPWLFPAGPRAAPLPSPGPRWPHPRLQTSHPVAHNPDTDL